MPSHRLQTRKQRSEASKTRMRCSAGVHIPKRLYRIKTMRDAIKVASCLFYNDTQLAQYRPARGYPTTRYSGTTMNLKRALEVMYSQMIDEMSDAFIRNDRNALDNIGQRADFSLMSRANLLLRSIKECARSRCNLSPLPKPKSFTHKFIELARNRHVMLRFDPRALTQTSVVKNLYILTKPIVINTQKYNMDVPFGPYIVNINDERMTRDGEGLARLRENLHIRIQPIYRVPARCQMDIIHPHAKDSHFCMGNHEGPVRRLIGNGQLLAGFDMIESILTNYDEASAYAPIDNWLSDKCENCLDPEGLACTCCRIIHSCQDCSVDYNLRLSSSQPVCCNCDSICVVEGCNAHRAVSQHMRNRNIVGRNACNCNGCGRSKLDICDYCATFCECGGMTCYDCLKKSDGICHNDDCTVNHFVHYRSRRSFEDYQSSSDRRFNIVG